MKPLNLPPLSGGHARLTRSGLSWLRSPGERVRAREPIAMCYVALNCGEGEKVPLPEERNDLQVVLSSAENCQIRPVEELSYGGFRDMVDSGDWIVGQVIAEAESLSGSPTVVPLVLAGRRGFECGEGRGSFLAGWHDRVRGFWEGSGEGRFGTVLALGTCEATAIFRGEDMAFQSWFARAPGPAQIVAIADSSCVHSSAVVLQHLRRTPEEAMAIADAVHGWVCERMGRIGPQSFPGFLPAASRGTFQGRWPEAQELAFASNLLAEAVGTSPILERSEAITSRGIQEIEPANVIALTLGSETAPHFRHRRTGWMIAVHGFRFSRHIGPGIIEWLRRDFEPVKRTVADIAQDLAALAQEVRDRTGALLLVQNLIASTTLDRIANYSWLGDAFKDCLTVFATDANLMLSDLTRYHHIAVLDSDALVAGLGVRECPDRYHASQVLIEAQRCEVHRVLRAGRIPGF